MAGIPPESHCLVGRGSREELGVMVMELRGVGGLGVLPGKKQKAHV